MARLTAATMLLICALESLLGKRAIRSDFFSTPMKCAFRKQGSGSPLSPGSMRITVGPGPPKLPKGTIRTESAASLKLRLSSERITTACLLLPVLAVQMSPRPGWWPLWLAIKVDFLRCRMHGLDKRDLLG